MADRYWVGGTASWDGTAGSKWSATSGGGGGASVPTTADDVFFDVLSTGTCTIATGNTGAKSINCTGFIGTITGTAAISVAGSVTLVAGMTYTHTGTMTFSGTGTLTTAGKTFSGVTVNGSGITLTLGDALNISNRNVTVTQGAFDTANYNVTVGALASSGSGVRTITLGSSTVTITASGVVLTFATSTNLTFNAGTSQISLSNASVFLLGGGQTFYNVSFTSTAVGTRSISGANTFNNLTIDASASGLSQLSLGANQTVSGTFTCAGTSATQRGFVLSDTIGTTRTLTCAAVSATDCDFRDITIAGAAAPISPTRGGNCGGNSGITFPAAKTVYWNLTGTQNWNATAWATTSNGTPAVNNFPLAQDTATFTNSGAATTVALALAYNIGALDASTRTSAVTLNHNATATRYGSYTLGSGVTVSGTSSQTFSGRSTMVFTSAGKTITFQIVADTPSSTFRLGDAYSSSSSVGLTRGTFDAFNYNLTCTSFNSGSGLTRTINMGSGLWTLTGTGTLWEYIGSNKTLNKDTANILLSNTTTTAREFRGGSLSYNKLTIGGATGTSVTTISFSDNSFTELASTKTVAHTVRIGANQGTIDTWSITGTIGNVVTVDSSTAGTRRTFNLTNVTSGIDYLSVKDIGVNQTNRFYVGANSTDGGNNSNVIFTAAPSGTQTLTPALFTNTNTFYLTTITQTGPPQSLLPGLYSNVNTFYAATVAASNEITPDRYDNTNAFYAATVAASNAITPARYDNTNVFYVATVTATGASQSLSASLLTNTQVFYSPVATSYNNLLPTLKGSDNFIYAASITATNNLTTSLLTNVTSFYSPVVTTLNTLSPPMFADSDFVFPPTVTAIGATQNLSASLFTNVSVIFAPTVSSAQPQPILGGGSLVRPRRKFRPAILLDIPEPEIVLPDVDAKAILAGLSVTMQLGSVVARSPDPINSRAKIGFTQIEAYTSTMVGRSSWNDPSDEELLFILDFALD